jgi:hypothetical protein
MSGPVEVVLIVAAVVYVMVRRMIGEPAQAKRMLVLPGVLAVIGLTDVAKQVHSAGSLGFLAVTIGISVLFGLLRGASVRVSQRGGLAFVRYTWVTVALWLANLAVKFGANLVASHGLTGAGGSLLLTLGAGMLVEGLVVMYRALRDNHPVMWADGENGGQGRMSPMLEGLRQNLNSRPRRVRHGRRDWHD